MGLKLNINKNTKASLHLKYVLMHCFRPICTRTINALDLAFFVTRNGTAAAAAAYICNSSTNRSPRNVFSFKCDYKIYYFFLDFFVVACPYQEHQLKII